MFLKEAKMKRKRLNVKQLEMNRGDGRVLTGKKKNKYKRNANINLNVCSMSERRREF